MTHELVLEGQRLSRELDIVLWKSPVGSEVPRRLHTREIDGGGAPEFHPAFLRWLDSGVCRCGREAQCAPGCRWAKDHVLGHLRDCQPACKDDMRFHASRHEQAPNRMKKALRSLRRLNPKAYDFVYLVVALHYTFHDAADKINMSNLQRGKPEQSISEFAVLWVSGASLLTAAY